MNTIGRSGLQNYMASRYAGNVGKVPGQQQGKGLSKEKIRELKQMVSGMNRQDPNKPNSALRSQSIVSSTLNYGEALKAQREKAKDASLQKKTLKYQFKDISSKIIRSKTSASAKQAAGQAKREVMRLKKAKQSEEYDPEEIEAALSHAKAMERVAKKKIKHLEEEEMIKAAGGMCADRMVDEEEALDKDFAEDMDDQEYEDEYAQEYGDVFATQEAYEDDYFSESDWMELMGANQEMAQSISDMFSGMEDLTAELMDDFAQSMQEMMEDMGMDELSDMAAVARKDMDPADFKMMKIKHRNKEMKDIVTADADYLKKIFDHLAKLKSEAAPSGGTPKAPQAIPTGGVSMPSGGGMAMPLSAPSGPMPSIDISL